MFKALTSKIQYPKLLVLLLCILLSYFLFRVDFFKQFAQTLNAHGYFSIFLGGFLFAYGFTAPFAVGFFVSLAPYVNIFPASLLAGFGALIADLIIFQFIKRSFQDEFDKLKLTWLVRAFQKLFNRHFQDRMKPYILWTIAGFLIASPLPDEFGVSLVSGFTNLDKKTFTVISYLLNTSGIFVILALA